MMPDFFWFQEWVFVSHLPTGHLCKMTSCETTVVKKVLISSNAQTVESSSETDDFVLDITWCMLIFFSIFAICLRFSLFSMTRFKKKCYMFVQVHICLWRICHFHLAGDDPPNTAPDMNRWHWSCAHFLYRGTFFGDVGRLNKKTWRDTLGKWLVTGLWPVLKRIIPVSECLGSHPFIAMKFDHLDEVKQPDP